MTFSKVNLDGCVLTISSENCVTTIDLDNVVAILRNDVPKSNEAVLNKEAICCPRCPCIIFREKTAFSTTDEFSLPIIAKKSDLQQRGETFPSEAESKFWTVERMTDFENVGFCNTVNGIKYLICADCEIGPLGYHDTHSATRGRPLFHIAASRVRTRDDVTSIS